MAKKLTKKEKQQINKVVRKNWKAVIAIALIVIVFLPIAYFMGWFDSLFKEDEPTLSTAGGYSTEVTTLKDLQVNFLNVGQGDCIIIELPDDKTMIIDSGEDNDAKQEIIDFTEENNITTFDYVILTHQDSDHAGNMNWVIDAYECKYIFRPNNYSSHSNSSELPVDFNTQTSGGYVSTTKTYSEFMVSAYNEKCTVEIFNKDSDFSNEIIYNGTSYTYKFEFLTPTADRDKIVYGDPNNYSPIMMLEYAGKKIMFTGDAEEDNIAEYVTTYGNANNIDVLKVGHHGSENATTLDFINAIDPEYAIIQCGEGNSYGHPHQETLDILGNHEGGVTIYRNDTNGLITLNIPQLEEINFDMENTNCANNYTAGIKFNKQDYFGYVENRKLLVA